MPKPTVTVNAKAARGGRVPAPRDRCRPTCGVTASCSRRPAARRCPAGLRCCRMRSARGCGRLSAAQQAALRTPAREAELRISPPTNRLWPTRSLWRRPAILAIPIARAVRRHQDSQVHGGSAAIVIASCVMDGDDNCPSGARCGSERSVRVLAIVGFVALASGRVHLLSSSSGRLGYRCSACSTSPGRSTTGIRP